MLKRSPVAFIESGITESEGFEFVAAQPALVDVCGHFIGLKGLKMLEQEIKIQYDRGISLELNSIYFMCVVVAQSTIGGKQLSRGAHHVDYECNYVHTLPVITV